jgi:hypothetical protein
MIQSNPINLIFGMFYQGTRSCGTYSMEVSTIHERSNDFSDRAAYILQQVIPEAISKVRDNSGKTPLRVKRFELSLNLSLSKRNRFTLNGVLPLLSRTLEIASGDWTVSSREGVPGAFLSPGIAHDSLERLL